MQLIKRQQLEIALPIVEVTAQGLVKPKDIELYKLPVVGCKHIIAAVVSCRCGNANIACEDIIYSNLGILSKSDIELRICFQYEQFAAQKEAALAQTEFEILVKRSSFQVKVKRSVYYIVCGIYINISQAAGIANGVFAP